MSGFTHEDLSRSLGRVEGEMGAAKDNITRVEDALTKRIDDLHTLVADGFKHLNERLDGMDKRVNSHETEAAGKTGMHKAIIAALGIIWSALTVVAGALLSNYSNK